MRTRLVAGLVAGFCFSVQALAQQCAHDSHAFTYPVSAKGAQVDQYHGVAVPDPYRWLEDANSEATKNWVIAQNKFTQDYLAQIPGRSAIKERLTKLWNYERFSAPSFEGKRYFLKRNNGLQNQAVLYTMRNLQDEPQVLLDPNKLSTDGTVALAETGVSPDGKYLAYATANAGSDWNEWKVKDIDTGKDLDDHLKWIKFSEVTWTPDSKGFYYSRFDQIDEANKYTAVNYFQKLYFHKLGTKQSEDVLVYHTPDQKEWSFGADVTDDDRYLIITVTQGTENKTRIYVQERGKKDAPVQKVLDAFDAEYEFLDSQGSVLYFRTDKDAVRGRIVALDMKEPGTLQEIVPQAGANLKQAHVVGGKFLLHYLKDARSQVLQYDLKGKFEREIALPGLGAVDGFKGGKKDQETFFSFTNFTTPETLYHLNVATGAVKLFRAPKLALDTSQYETRQVFYTSRDGTRVPMFVSSKKGLPLNGKQPTILYGYGGFNIALTPKFSTANIAWMEMGGIYVVANLRGGGEYGQQWYEAGTKLQKQNVFDDFIAAAEFLISNKYTNPQKLAIAGGSNGGLLVGATMTQRPELFAAALPSVGVLDMLRYHQFTSGWGWRSDYGTADDAAQFKALFAYSPLHNLKTNTCYPATMVSTGDHDDRVVPAHSFKFAAAAQAVQGGKAPILIRIDVRAGHGAGKPTSKMIEEAADKFAFLRKVLGMTDKP